MNSIYMLRPTMQQSRDKDSNASNGQQSYFYVVWPDDKPLLTTGTNHAALHTTLVNKVSTIEDTEAAKRDSNVVLNYKTTATYSDVSDELLAQKAPQLSSPIMSPNGVASTSTIDELQTTKQDSPIAIQAQAGTMLLAANGGHGYSSVESTNGSLSAPDLIMSNVGNFNTVSVSSSQRYSPLTNGNKSHAQTFSSKNGTTVTTAVEALSYESPFVVRESRPGQVTETQQHFHHHARKQRNPQARHSPHVQGDSCLHEIGILAEQAIANLQKITSFTRMASKPNGLNGIAINQNDEEAVPSSKRPCSRGTSGCLECEVKDAEITILRKRLNSLEMALTSTTTAASMGRSYTPPQSRSPPLPMDYQQIPGLIQPTADRELLFTRKRRLESHSKPQEEIQQNQMVTVSGQTSTSDYVELTAGSGVYIPVYKLEEAKREAKTGTQLARKLMDVFWDKDTLARSTLTPKSKFQYQQLDPKTIKAIEAFCLVYDTTVHSKDIHATMTDKCCQARSRYRTLQ